MDKQVRKRHLLHCSCQGHTSRSRQRGTEKPDTGSVFLAGITQPQTIVALLIPCLWDCNDELKYIHWLKKQPHSGLKVMFLNSNYFSRKSDCQYTHLIFGVGKPEWVQNPEVRRAQVPAVFPRVTLQFRQESVMQNSSSCAWRSRLLHSLHARVVLFVYHELWGPGTQSGSEK